jgi:hypothetical protein
MALVLFAYRSVPEHISDVPSGWKDGERILETTRHLDMGEPVSIIQFGFSKPT